ncbi:MAG: hypothetical protein ACNA8H_02425 [Anaerolineales bacterium]
MNEFTPELVSRRGELLAWSSTVLVTLAWIILSQADQRIPFAVPLLALILLFASLSISLGNWMDRQTVIRLSAAGIAFRNGLRNLHLRWADIKQVKVLPSNWGNKVHVISDQAHFQFRTLGEVKFQGEVKGRMGFPEGKYILEQIISQANLKPAPKSSQENADQKGIVYYYTRQ